MNDETSSARSEWNDAVGRTTIAPYLSIDGGLLPALQAVQDRFGFIPSAAAAMLADAFNLSRAEVHGVITFYRDFQTVAPAGRHVLTMCRAEACQAVGAGELTEYVRGRLGITWNETTSDNNWTLRPTYCLGLCACGPSGLVDGRPVARLDRQKLDEILKGLWQ